MTNMLNTCYLSAAMQCLAHTDALKDLFLSNSYKADADLGNPVGDQGLVADAFAELMTNMWQVCTLPVPFTGHNSVFEHAASLKERFFAKFLSTAVSH